MTCPVCNAQNSAMSARCLECGTILIAEAVPRSANVKKASDDLDLNLYSGYGGIAGFVIGFLSWVAFSQDESEAKFWLGFCVCAGAVLGRVIAWRKRMGR